VPKSVLYHILGSMLMVSFRLDYGLWEIVMCMALDMH
jgi:hypothetical protein